MTTCFTAGVPIRSGHTACSMHERDCPGACDLQGSLEYGVAPPHLETANMTTHVRRLSLKTSVAGIL